MLDEYFEKVRQPGQEINPVLKFLGIRVEEVSGAEAVLSLEIRRELLHSGGFTAGGIIATLADEAMGHVVAAGCGEGQGTATIEMNVRYLKTVKSGEVRARAKIIKRGRNVVTAEAEVKNESGVLLARAGASFTVFDFEEFLKARKD